MLDTVVPMPDEGLFWHVHHAELLEWCYSYAGRKAYICTMKSRYEISEAIELRLRLFRPVGGSLPGAVTDALRNYAQTGIVYGEARAAYSLACDRPSRAPTTYALARAALFPARDAYDQAQVAAAGALRTYHAEIERLHAVEYLNCPWDGKTIFPRS